MIVMIQIINTYDSDIIKDINNSNYINDFSQYSDIVSISKLIEENTDELILNCSINKRY